MSKKPEFCIMPDSHLYKTERFYGSHRHEVFGGTANRKKSIKYGLVVFLRPEMHNLSNKGIHFDIEFNIAVKQIAQLKAMEHYGWSVDEFRSKFGKSYL